MSCAEVTVWTIPDFGDEECTITVSLTCVETVSASGLDVPVWQVANCQPEARCFSGRFVRYIDLPAKMHESFARWQFGAQQPFVDAAYDYDFLHFLASYYRPSRLG